MKIKYFIVSALALGTIASGLAFNQSSSKADSSVVPKVVVAKHNTVVMSAHQASKEGLSIIKQNAPFKVLLPGESKLSQDALTGAFMGNVKDGTAERHVDFFYKTPNGDVHIWETNMDEKNAEKDPINVPGYKEQKIKIGNQQWSYTVNQDDNSLQIFTTKINGNIIQVSGNIPYDQLIEVISSLS